MTMTPFTIIITRTTTNNSKNKQTMTLDKMTNTFQYLRYLRNDDDNNHVTDNNKNKQIITVRTSKP